MVDTIPVPSRRNLLCAANCALTLNNVVEQDHRAVKRQVRPMMGFKSFWSAAVTLAGIELIHMLRKGQLKATGRLRPAQQFYSLAS